MINNAPKPLSPATIVLLQSYNCGYEGRSPKVCCPNIDTSPPIPVTQPTEAARSPPDVSGHRNIGLVSAANCGPVALDRIYGGNKTAPFEFPWMALIAYNTSKYIFLVTYN